MLSGCSVTDNMGFQRQAIPGSARSGGRLRGFESGNLGLSPCTVHLMCFIFLDFNRRDANSPLLPATPRLWQGRDKLLNKLKNQNISGVTEGTRIAHGRGASYEVLRWVTTGVLATLSGREQFFLAHKPLVTFVQGLGPLLVMLLDPLLTSKQKNERRRYRKTCAHPRLNHVQTVCMVPTQFLPSPLFE